LAARNQRLADGIALSNPNERRHDMRVSDAMTRDVCVARPDHTIEEAARMMLAIDVGLLPVATTTDWWARSRTVT
jgi:CBS domain-containing protein